MQRSGSPMLRRGVIAALALLGLVALTAIGLTAGAASASLAAWQVANPPGGGKAAAPQSNMVVNGDFETGNISPWTTALGSGSAAIVTTPVHAGTFAARVTTGATAGTS